MWRAAGLTLPRQRSTSPGRRIGDPRVRRVVGDPEEERLAERRPAADEVDGLGRVDVARVGLRGGGVDRVLVRVAVADQLPVLEQVVAVVGVLGLLPVPLAVAGRDADGARLVAVQVLADQPRVVAGALQPDGQGLVAAQDVEATLRGDVVEHPVVVRVLAGEEGRPRRAAERKGGETLLERRALGADQAQGPRHGADRRCGLVVGHHHDDVRRVGRARPRRRRPRSARVPARATIVAATQNASCLFDSIVILNTHGARLDRERAPASTFRRACPRSRAFR